MVYRPKNQTEGESAPEKSDKESAELAKEFESKLTTEEKPKSTQQNKKPAKKQEEEAEEVWDDDYEEDEEYDEYDEEGEEWEEGEEGDEEYDEEEGEYEEGDEEEKETPTKPSEKSAEPENPKEESKKDETQTVTLEQEISVAKDSGVSVEKHVAIETEKNNEIKVKEFIEIKQTDTQTETNKTEKKKNQKTKKEKIPQPQKVTQSIEKANKANKKGEKSNKKQEEERPKPFSYIKDYVHDPKLPQGESSTPPPVKKDTPAPQNNQKPQNNEQRAKNGNKKKEEAERAPSRGGRGGSAPRGSQRGAKTDDEREERAERWSKGKGEEASSRGGSKAREFKEERGGRGRDRGGRGFEGNTRGGRKDQYERRNNKEGGRESGKGEGRRNSRREQEEESRENRGGRKGRGGGRGGRRGEEEGRDSHPASRRDQKRQYKPMTLQEAEAGLKKGQLFEGVIKFNFKQSNEGYVSLAGEERDICILGPTARNKSLPGDTVIFKIIPKPTILLDKKKNRNKKFKESKKAENKHAEASQEQEEEEEEEEQTEKESEKSRKYGKVVFIRKRTENLEFLGTFRKDQGNTAIYKFFPNHKGVPLFVVNNLDLSKKNELFEKYEQSIDDQLKDNFFSVKFISWNDNNAVGTIVNNFGAIDRTETQYEVLKYDNNIFHTEEFPENIYKQLPTDDWKITEKDLQNRVDLRGTTIFTIDPKTAKDLDDALSCELLEGGNFRVGVHIADVSHFVPLGSPLDDEAKKRATTVYLAQENIPMLPRILADKLCSLEENVDRLAFSVSWILSPQGDILEESFFKSIIRSARKFAYEDVHEIIADPSKFRNDANQSKCTQAIIYLDKLAKTLKQKRYENGSLDLDTPEIYFEFDAEGNITDVKPYIRFDSHFLIEEFMLLANISVARKISGVNGENKYASRPGALLRRHEPPQPSKILDFLDRCNNDLHLDIPAASTSKDLHHALQIIRNQHGEDIMNAILHSVRPLKAACYLPVAQKIVEDEDFYAHFALHFPFYTHFTSPIRRYADLIVHHQLEHLLLDKPFPLKQGELESICENCNTRKSDADYAQRQCAQLFLNKYLSERNISATGIIVDIKKQYLSVYVPSFDAFRDIKLADGKSNGDYNFNAPKIQKDSAPSITIKWTNSKEEVLHLLERIQVRLFHATERHFKTIGIKLIPPSERNAITTK